MNALNHLLTTFNLCYFLFNKTNTLLEICLFSLIFGVFIDMEMVVGLIRKKPREYLRSWVQEPFAIILIATPIAIILSTIKSNYFFLVLIPYTLHIFLDYLTQHYLVPLAPFNNKRIKSGFFKESFRYGKKEIQQGVSENWFLLANIIILMINLLI